MNKQKQSGKYDIVTKEFLPTHKVHRDKTWNAAGVWDKRYPHAVSTATTCLGKVPISALEFCKIVFPYH